ncbi:MAG TPA: DUF2834 domain-containing protein [Leptospiraceae bacterium]|nr:DUF2834 domain-containing protein [Leptospiraceae bacterium]HMY68070.1 DUF2834 domain-containing protein [Leptospiraceae bacterium]HNF14105.1 DUF2834 domain-containing protein [Leptospiraceae bacterium]HNF26088.1 DUF2834 domain-containing protein [Leptospiraceae bacterium]HNI95476.1 DUF2834 domain-containing protein [Leptospiraceae bacterium]
MNSLFKGTILSLGLGFAVAFGIIVLPAFFKNPDIFGAFAAGFVNPFAAGYSMDTIFCWLILAIWVAYEARVRQIRYGWVCVLLGIVPGVATGFAFYLLIRMHRVNKNAVSGDSAI